MWGTLVARGGEVEVVCPHISLMQETHYKSAVMEIDRVVVVRGKVQARARV